MCTDREERPHLGRNADWRGPGTGECHAGIIEDNVFVGGNCGIYEGTIIEERAVIGTGVILNGSTPVFDNTTGEFLRKSDDAPLKVPAGAVVVAGSRPVRSGPGKDHGIHLYCPVIIKYRDQKTSSSITLEELLR